VEELEIMETAIGLVRSGSTGVAGQVIDSLSPEDAREVFESVVGVARGVSIFVAFKMGLSFDEFMDGFMGYVREDGW